ncbi:hypothetical protein SAMN05443545_106164 [Aidingimonas halophila]|uniref:Uncharacterized protein n=1 Tax=Aidingimonas halophila TaxID=574349 RepID=A0A1H3D1T6_9GAMM|nr:hypothetical protein SAMN05443545_106164 [Aidingimonas halophila]
MVTFATANDTLYRVSTTMDDHRGRFLLPHLFLFPCEGRVL